MVTNQKGCGSESEDVHQKRIDMMATQNLSILVKGEDLLCPRSNLFPDTTANSKNDEPSEEEKSKLADLELCTSQYYHAAEISNIMVKQSMC